MLTGMYKGKDGTTINIEATRYDPDIFIAGWVGDAGLDFEKLFRHEVESMIRAGLMTKVEDKS